MNLNFFKQVRIWSDYNLGTLKKTDLFATDNRMNVIPINNTFSWEIALTNQQKERYKEISTYLNGE